MRCRRYKLILIWSGIVLRVSFIGYREIAEASTRIRIAFADEQTAMSDEMREKVERADPAEATNYPRYAVDYYPSGTKQVPGSALDRLVERARRNSVREMFANLRVKTHHDLGDDPRRWIDALRAR